MYRHANKNNTNGFYMQIKTQTELIEAVWINCNRISCLGNVSIYYIISGGQSLPSFYISFLEKNFKGWHEYNSFFSDVNKAKNYNKFIQMLNAYRYFTVQDILISGSMSQKQGLGYAPVEEVEYTV